MKILFIGDIVGRPGRKAVRELLPKLVDNYKVEFTIGNAENAAGGLGINPEIAWELLGYGIDILTSGNHIWKHKEINDFLDQEKRLLRPANYPGSSPGKGSVIFESLSGLKIGVINLEGRVFMKNLDDPFRVSLKEIEGFAGKTKIIIVDIHAEATSEKQALGVYLDGKVSAVVGTHTHVQTADDKILPGGTAYITDIGMTGPLDSVIGIKKEVAIEKFLTQRPERFVVAKGGVRIQGVVLEIDPETGKGLSIERFNVALG
ncbi:MAG: TIGR00282 family metallophosphoesterase [Deltaproteobacteria bacterium]|nr:MAG: TIGR00282 family metallophosphoesterase [Deltaproteobacteria bacterium]